MAMITGLHDVSAQGPRPSTAVQPAPDTSIGMPAVTPGVGSVHGNAGCGGTCALFALPSPSRCRVIDRISEVSRVATARTPP